MPFPFAKKQQQTTKLEIKLLKGMFSEKIFRK